MVLDDKNKSWFPPEGYLLTNISADGALTRIEYRRLLSDAVSIVGVYVNDQGREVMRTIDVDDLYIAPTPRPPRFGLTPSFWDRILDLLEAVCRRKW